MARSLSQFDYRGSWVLPYTRWSKKQHNYFLLGREAFGSDIGTFDAFGGGRDSGEKHPVVTAAREFSEETLRILFSTDKEAREYIDLAADHTRDIVANEAKKAVVYITQLDHSELEKFVSEFFPARAQLIAQHVHSSSKLLEKDELAWAREDHLQAAIADAPRDRSGRLITPITIWAEVFEKSGKVAVARQIVLRPLLVSILQSYYAGVPHEAGKDPGIKFYER